MNMTSFNPGGGERDPTEWKELAFKNASEDSSQIKFIGTFVAAGIAGIMASPATGLLVGGLGLYWTIKGVYNKGRSRTAVAKYNMVAPFLEERDFLDYSRQVVRESGQQALIDELIFASENGFDIPDAAYDFIEKCAPHLIEGKKQVPAVAPIVQTQAIDFKEELLANLTRDLAKNCPRLIIYGVPGSGKDFFLSHLYREIKALYGDKVTIFMMDCKNEVKETGYFEGVVDRLYRKSVFTSSPKDVLKWAKRIIDDYDNFDAGNGFKVLVCNELASLNSSLMELPKDKELGTKPLQWWIGKLSRYGSSGDSAGVRLYFASQNGHGDSVKLSGGDKAILKPFLIAQDESMSETELILQADVIPQKAKIGTDEMLKLCATSPVGRCMFHGGMNKWIAMPALENFSGYNRDAREYIARPGQQDALSDEEREALRERTATVAKPYSQSEIIISKLQQTNARTLAEFVYEELGVEAAIVEKTCRAIFDLLKADKREDLLNKFPALEPNEEIKKWVQMLGRKPAQEELKKEWLKLTGKQLNDRGVKMLLENLGFKD